MTNFLINFEKIRDIYMDMNVSEISHEGLPFIKCDYPLGTFERLIKSLREGILSNNRIAIYENENSQKIVLWIDSISEFEKWIKDNFPNYNQDND